MDVGENMLVNQGEEAFEEGEKAKKTVKATKASMKEYAAATVFLVLRMEEIWRLQVHSKKKGNDQILTGTGKLSWREEASHKERKNINVCEIRPYYFCNVKT